ncbi:MAG: hypothetical protein PHT16_00650 [Candidatus Pacebacteria bacterium]|nr:hypothetical protein [Candidatus Paceibacterota bacterium]
MDNNTDNTTDLLQIKIDEAKAQLPEETRNAINAVDYKAVILEMRKTKGYTFEQLGDLETETELLLSGLTSPENYSKELENRMHLSKVEVNELIKEMNDRVFAKIKENLIKSSEGKNDMKILNSAGIEIISTPSSKLGTPQEGNNTPPILAQKLSGSFQVPVVKTEHSLENITKTIAPTPINAIPSKPAVDPYREIPE